MVSYALLFPGQGSQYVGMGKSFLHDKKSAQLFDEAEEVLSIPLKKLMFEGPMEELTATAIAQPAILLHSIAVYYHLKERLDFNPTCALGHSLGEYSALVAAGVMPLNKALKVVNIRGKLMQEAVPEGLGAMAAVIGMDADEIVKALLEFSDEKSADYASCANFNGPMQTVIAGTKSGVLKAKEKLKSLFKNRIVDLPVSAPFHCALMKPVQRRMAEVLNAIEFKDAAFPIVSNVSAEGETKGARIRELLLKQISSPVRFTDCVNYVEQHGLGNGFLELGPKTALSGIVTKMNSDFATAHVDTLEDAAQFIK